MKKLFILFSIIGIITLTSCGAQEECRSRGSYVNKQDINQLNENLIVSTPFDKEIN